VGETRLQLVLQTAPVLDESVIIDDGNSEPNTHKGRQVDQEETAGAAEIEADSVDFELAADQGAPPATPEELDEESALSALVLLTAGNRYADFLHPDLVSDPGTDGVANA
jgi:hypothetical protein